MPLVVRNAGPDRDLMRSGKPPSLKFAARWSPTTASSTLMSAGAVDQHLQPKPPQWRLSMARRARAMAARPLRALG